MIFVIAKIDELRFFKMPRHLSIVYLFRYRDVINLFSNGRLFLALFAQIAACPMQVNLNVVDLRRLLVHKRRLLRFVLSLDRNCRLYEWQEGVVFPVSHTELVFYLATKVIPISTSYLYVVFID